MENFSVNIPIHANVALTFNNLAQFANPSKFHAPTSALLNIMLHDAQEYSMKYGISAPTGYGKTFSAMDYARRNRGVKHIFCNEGYTVKAFRALIAANKETTLFIFDDAHKLSDACLREAVKVKCGAVILGNSELRQRVLDGVKAEKPHSAEIYNAIGKHFITM